MEKKYIVQFLKEKKRGVYSLIVNTYIDVISTMGINMALHIIKDDLEKETGTSVEINYFSLAKAAAKVPKKVLNKSTSLETSKWEFKDAYETNDQKLIPGRFKLDQSD